MVAALKPGDEVVTNGGIYGKITRVGEDAITVEIAEKVRVRVTPASVSRLVYQFTSSELSPSAVQIASAVPQSSLAPSAACCGMARIRP